MTIGIYNPYHDTLGGGEQYMFTLAEYFLRQNARVIYFSNDVIEIKKAQERFGLSLEKLIVQPPVFESGSFIEKLHVTKSLDKLLFYSDGSIPVSFAKNTYLVFQFPVPWVKTQSLLNRLKTMRSTKFIVNSQFTKKFIDTTFQSSAEVLYPSVSVDMYSTEEKKQQILSVGRFTKGMNTKRQDILIEAFKKLVDEGLKGWKFILAGGVLDRDIEEVKKYEEIVHGYPVEFFPNVSRERLLHLYATSPIYWHAAGFGVNEQDHPEQVEHFGISTLEAMASSAVPLVYKAGGQKEIVVDGSSGFFWETITELTSKTYQLVSEKDMRISMQPKVLERSKDFDQEFFFKNCERLFSTT